MLDKDKDKKKVGYKLRVRRLMANPPQPKQKRNRNQPKPQPTPKQNLPKLQQSQKMMIKFLKGVGAKPKVAARIVKFANRKLDNRY